MSRVIDRSMEGMGAQEGGAKRIRVVCDAGNTRAEGCLVAHDGPDTPPGWVAAMDAWGRRSRFSGTTLVLHLCAACVHAADEQGRRRLPTSGTVAREYDNLSKRGALAYPDEGTG